MLLLLVSLHASRDVFDAVVCFEEKVMEQVVEGAQLPPSYMDEHACSNNPKKPAKDDSCLPRMRNRCASPCSCLGIAAQLLQYSSCRAVVCSMCPT
jgi:hypothetical protein